MKTTNVPLIGSCPDWDEDDIPPDRLAYFQTLLNQVQQEILDFATKALITPDDVRGWHGTLFRKFVPLYYYAGHFRGLDAGRPCLACNVRVGPLQGSDCRFARQDVRILFAQIHSDFADLELAWNQITPADRAKRLAVIIGNFVGGFIRIHPFKNGNGRTSRLLWRWCLLRFGVPVQCRVHPRPAPPYGELMRQSMAGNYYPLIIHILAHLAANAPTLKTSA